MRAEKIFYKEKFYDENNLTKPVNCQKQGIAKNLSFGCW